MSASIRLLFEIDGWMLICVCVCVLVAFEGGCFLLSVFKQRQKKMAADSRKPVTNEQRPAPTMEQKIPPKKKKYPIQELKQRPQLATTATTATTTATTAKETTLLFTGSKWANQSRHNRKMRAKWPIIGSWSAGRFRETAACYISSSFTPPAASPPPSPPAPEPLSAAVQLERWQRRQRRWCELSTGGNEIRFRMAPPPLPPPSPPPKLPAAAARFDSIGIQSHGMRSRQRHNQLH